MRLGRNHDEPRWAGRDHALEQAEQQVDRFQVYYSLLLPLENVKQNPRYHPEGDVLYHSLQVFDTVHYSFLLLF